MARLAGALELERVDPDAALRVDRERATPGHENRVAQLGGGLQAAAKPPDRRVQPAPREVRRLARRHDLDQLAASRRAATVQQQVGEQRGPGVCQGHPLPVLRDRAVAEELCSQLYSGHGSSASSPTS